MPNPPPLMIRVGSDAPNVSEPEIDALSQKLFVASIERLVPLFDKALASRGKLGFVIVQHGVIDVTDADPEVVAEVAALKPGEPYASCQEVESIAASAACCAATTVRGQLAAAILSKPVAGSVRTVIMHANGVVVTAIARPPAPGKALPGNHAGLPS